MDVHRPEELVAKGKPIRRIMISCDDANSQLWKAAVETVQKGTEKGDRFSGGDGPVINITRQDEGPILVR